MISSDAISGLVGVVIGAFISILGDEFRQWREKKRRGHYLAVRVSPLIEKFIEECADVVEDKGIEDKNGVTNGNVADPAEIYLPEDVDWKSIKPSLMQDIVTLPDRVRKTRQHIAFVLNYVAVPPEWVEFFAVRSRVYLKLGMEAIELVDKIRKYHRIPQEIPWQGSPTNRLRLESEKDSLRKKQELKS